jgi:adenylyltransferase/sulfurtransferase
VLGDAPTPGSSPTCDTAGVIAPIVQVIAGLQGAEALKILSGHPEAVKVSLTSIDVWSGQFDRIDLTLSRPATPARGEFVPGAKRRRSVSVRPGRGSGPPARAGMSLDIADFAVAQRSAM